jgi:hypothetical protein
MLCSVSTNNPTSIPAHFDGEQILLDEPVELERNTQLLVTVLPKGLTDREAWLRMSAARLDAAYNGEEDDYPLSAVKEINPDYEGR